MKNENLSHLAKETICPFNKQKLNYIRNKLKQLLSLTSSQNCLKHLVTLTFRDKWLRWTIWEILSATPLSHPWPVSLLENKSGWNLGYRWRQKSRNMLSRVYNQTMIFEIEKEYHHFSFSSLPATLPPKCIWPNSIQHQTRTSPRHNVLKYSLIRAATEFNFSNYFHLYLNTFTK